MGRLRVDHPIDLPVLRARLERQRVSHAYLRLELVRQSPCLLQGPLCSWEELHRGQDLRRFPTSIIWTVAGRVVGRLLSRHLV